MKKNQRKSQYSRFYFFHFVLGIPQSLYKKDISPPCSLDFQYNAHLPLLRLIESRWISLSSIILLISDKTKIVRESIKFRSCNYDAE